MKMTPGLKMEIFAYDIFQTAFLSHRLIQDKPSIFEIYGDEFFEDPSYDEACDDLFHKAIFCRRELFQIIYKGELMYEKIEGCKSPSDLFDYLINLCNQDYLFHNLNVFERMFATCAFVVSMCVHIYWYNVVDVISNGHKFWAIFFDHYTEEFYKEGGWNELKRVAKTYDLLYEFLALFPENFDNYLSAIKEATVNYSHFKEVSLSKDSKPVSKMWVRFHIKNIGNYIKIPANYEISLNPTTIEFLLGELRQYCDPRCFNEFTSRSNDSDSDDKSQERNQVKIINEFVSRIDDSCSSMDGSDSGKLPRRCQGSDFSAGMVSKTFKTNSAIKPGDVGLQTLPLLLAYKRRISESFNGKLSNSSFEYNEQIQKKHSVFNLEADTVEHLLKNGNREHEEKTINEKELSTNTSELDPVVCSLNKHNILVVETKSQPLELSTEKSPNNENLDFAHSIANYDQYPDNESEIDSTNKIHSIITKIESEITNVREDSFSNQIVESLWEAESPLKNLTQKQFNLINEHTHIGDERKNEKTMDDYFDSRKREINETVKPIDVFTKLKATSLDIAHNRKGVDLVSGYVSSDHKKESIIKTSKFIFDLIKREMDIGNPIVAPECHRKTSPNISQYIKDFNLINATVNSGGKRKIIQRKLDELRKEQDDTKFNQFSRTLLTLESMGAIEYAGATLEMLENSSECFKNPKKRIGNEEESSRKKISPERKELENEISDSYTGK